MAYLQLTHFYLSLLSKVCQGRKGCLGKGSLPSWKKHLRMESPVQRVSSTRETRDLQRDCAGETEEGRKLRLLGPFSHFFTRYRGLHLSSRARLFSSDPLPCCSVRSVSHVSCLLGRCCCTDNWAVCPQQPSILWARRRPGVLVILRSDPSLLAVTPEALAHAVSCRFLAAGL